MSWSRTMNTTFLSPQKLLEKFVGQKIQLATIESGDKKGGDR